MQEQQGMPREQQPQGAEARCPECGQPVWGPQAQWGPWGMKRMGPWAKGPWGGHMHHAGHWGPRPMGMACIGIVPAILGFALGYMVASARMSAMYAFACEEKRKH